MLVTTWHYEPVGTSASAANVERGGRPVWSWPQGISATGIAVGIAGTPRVLTLSASGVELEVSSRELDWRVRSIGPVLPVIPNFIGGGMEPEPTLALHLHVAQCDEPVRVLLDRTRVRTADGTVHALRACLAGDAAWDGASPEQAAPLAEDPTLERGGGLWIAFDLRHTELDAFELELAFATARGAPLEATLGFTRSQATSYVLAWWPPAE